MQCFSVGRIAMRLLCAAVVLAPLEAAAADGADPMSPKAALIAFAIFAVIMWPIAAWQLLSYRRILARVRASQSWPSVAGEIVRSDVGTSTGLLEVMTKAPEDQITYYRANVRYRYEAAGRQIEGSTIRFGLDDLREAAARAIVERYPIGRAVHVRVDPADPENSVLEPVGDAATIRLWIGIVAAAMPAILTGGLWLGLRYLY